VIVSPVFRYSNKSTGKRVCFIGGGCHSGWLGKPAVWVVDSKKKSEDTVDPFWDYHGNVDAQVWRVWFQGFCEAVNRERILQQRSRAVIVMDGASYHMAHEFPSLGNKNKQQLATILVHLQVPSHKWLNKTNPQMIGVCTQQLL